ncbi:MAG TPA: DUF4199 domain-containing protein [Rhizomicrobium sp.]|jgi:hypothetical protein
MFRKILTYGVVAGLIVGIPLSILTATNGCSPGLWSMVIGYSTMLVALSTVFVAVKRHRDIDLGGVIGFWPALGIGLGISIIASIIYVAAWEATVAIAHIDFAAGYAQALIAQEKAKGVSGAALAQFIAQMDQFKKDYANPFYRLPMTFVEIFPVGVLVSLATAGLLRNRRFMPARRA